LVVLGNTATVLGTVWVNLRVRQAAKAAAVE
ncbi:MAG: hypothetical protein ACI9KE_005534, partial [Polyangiales bacterium]